MSSSVHICLYYYFFYVDNGDNAGGGGVRDVYLVVDFVFRFNFSLSFLYFFVHGLGFGLSNNVSVGTQMDMDNLFCCENIQHEKAFRQTVLFV